MTELHTLVNGLKTEEINSIRYSFYKGNKPEKEEAAVEKLFDFLILNQNKELDDEVISKQVYGDNKPEALKRLKSRLFSKILDTFISDAFLLKEGVLDSADKQAVRIRKKILQVRILYRKKNTVDKSILFHIIAEITKEAKEYELYGVLAEVLGLKKYMNTLRKGIFELKELNKQIKQYNYAHEAVLRAGDIFYEIVANQDLVKENSFSELDTFVNDSLKELNAYFEETKSITILYYSKQIQLAHLQRQNKHQETIDVCLDMINLLNENKCIFRIERMAGVYSNISKCLVFTGDFAGAIENAKKSQQLYSSKNINYVIAKEQEFYSLFYGEEYTKAKPVLDELLKIPLINSGEFRQDKFLFFKACVHFQLKEYKESQLICNQLLELSHDKSRWDLGMRYLRIMCLVETQLHDQAYASVEALRKIMGRSKTELKGRDELIYKAFNEFSRNAFTALDNTKLNQLLTELSEKEGKSAWTYYSHELIPIHEWLKKKVKTSSVDQTKLKAKK